MNATPPEVHVCIPHGHYIGQVRGRGCRKWQTVTGRCTKSESALSAALRKMHWSDHRARALFVDDSPYYEPSVVMEAKRK